jgi:hypothetical protein
VWVFAMAEGEIFLAWTQSAGGPGQAQKNENRTIQAYEVFVIKTAHSRPNLGPGYGNDLIYHQAAWGTQTVFFVRNDGKPKQWSICRVRGECADCDRSGGIEAVILYDDCGTRFSRILLTAGNRPNFATPHSVFQSDIASTKS